MEECVLGVDLGTSSVKVLAVNRQGKTIAQEKMDFPLHQPLPGYAEQNPEDWVNATTVAIVRLILNDRLNPNQIKGISYSGQMHGLVLLDKDNQVLRPAMLWNDTRSTKQRFEIMNRMGEKFVKLTHNLPLEGFTLPKLLWVKENQPDIFKKVKVMLLPKDYLRFRMTNNLAIDYSDATGTVMIDVQNQCWSKEILNAFNIPESICPKLVKSIDNTGNISQWYAKYSGLSVKTVTFAGGADNACGAVGAGIDSSNKILSSIGTSGVILKYEENKSTNYEGILQFEDHAIPNAFYSMGVTLSAGFSLNWFKNTFAAAEKFDDVINGARESSVGANGLLFAPYIMGERAPYADANIRGSFIGIDGIHKRCDFVRAVLEGIIFSFKDILNKYEENNSHFDTVIAIGGGAKSKLWQQIQANIFNVRVISLSNDQGPGLGAAMLAAVGLEWFNSVKECAVQFVHFKDVILPNSNNVQRYQELYKIYKKIYPTTKDITHELVSFRKNY
ncbi:MAG: xylulokinase [Liquorilactobacillus nagelii]|uniref:xylulokinase n=1 Tax=Liquorilactobacillus nagelii TaxID=82688 RepID=UPI0039EBE3B0